MEQFRTKHGFIIDMDGVIYHGNRLLPGAKELVNWLYAEGKRFLFLTNGSREEPAGTAAEAGAHGPGGG